MSYFECIPVKTPKSGCDGTVVVRFGNQQIFVLWREKEAHLYNISPAAQKDNITTVLTLNTNIISVFQMGDNVCCLGSNASLYKLCKTKKPVAQESYESGDEDIFDSGDSADEGFQISELQFVCALPLKNVINICALSRGFAIVQEVFGKLFIEIFSVSDSLIKPEKIISKEIPYVSPKILNKNECILVAVKQRKMARDFIGALIGDMSLLDIEIIFIGFKNGQVFYLPSIKTAHVPKLLYSSFHQVMNILFLQSGTNMKLVIALEPGLLIEVRFSDKLSGHLEYVTSCLPGTIHSSCAVGSHLLVGDGNWLWCWQPEASKQSFNIGASGGQGPQISQLAVRGATHLCSLQDNETALAITVHGTIYKLSPQLLNEAAPSGGDCDIQSDLSASLKHQLQLLEETEKKILNEDNLIAAVGLAMHSELLKSCFSMIVTVDDVTSKIPSEFLQEPTTGLHGFYKAGKHVFNICLQNSSEKEFSSDVWCIHIVIKSENQTVNRVVHFKDVFKKECDINTTICTDIENVALSINITSTLVCKMPPAQSSEQTILPALFIPVDTVTLSIGYFFTPILSLSEDTQNITSQSNSSQYRSLLPKIRENYTKCENFSDISVLEKEYVCKIKLPKSINKYLLWSQMFKRSSHRCSSDVQSWFQSSMDRIRIDQTLWVRAGQHLSKFVVGAGCNAVEVYCKDPVTLHAIKSYITEEMQAISRCSSSIKIPSSVIDVAQSIRLNLDIERHQPTVENLERIRKEWRASVIEKLPP